MNRSAPLFAALLLAACGSRPTDKITVPTDSSAHHASDSLVSAAALERTFAKESSLLTTEKLPGPSIPGRYSGTLHTAALRSRAITDDSTKTFYFVSLDSEDLHESVSEYEVASVVRGIDSMTAILARPSYPGSSRSLSYNTSQGVRVGYLAGSALGDVVYVGGSGGTFFLHAGALPILRSAILASRDSITALKAKP